MKKFDVSVVLVFHHEGLLANPALQSYHLLCDEARAHGLNVERIAILDRPNEITSQMINSVEGQFHRVETVDFGDLGLSRNAGRDISKGEFLAFLDGDDLWGQEWVWRAYDLASEAPSGHAVYHPEYILYFSEDDYLISRNEGLPRGAKSFFMIHPDSANARFDPLTLVINNVWTANSLAHRTVFEKFPYFAIDAISGFGVEDWTWNAETLAAGVRHAMVTGTIHCVRVKTSGSLGTGNIVSGILPAIHKFASALENA